MSVLAVVWQEAALFVAIGVVIGFLVTLEVLVTSQRRRERSERPGYIPFAGGGGQR